MEKKPDGEVEWKIQNVSRWNRDVHGKKIKSPFCSVFESEIRLYPRGLSGEDEYVAVTIDCAFQGDMSFCGSDGSTLRTIGVGLEKHENAIELLTKFKEVVPDAGKFDPPSEDSITLRFRLDSVENGRQPDEGRAFSMCTTLDVFALSLKIVPKLAKDNTLAVIKYSFPKCDAEETVRMRLMKGITRHDGKTKLQLEPFWTQNVFMVQSRICLLGDPEACEENTRVFRNTEPWTVSNAMKLDELAERDSTILLNLKIVYDHTRRDPTVFCPTPGVSLVTNPSEKPSKSCNSTGGVIARDFLNLYRSHNVSDVEVMSDEMESFPAHKSVLSARSPVFEKMFTIDNEISVVKLDLDSPALNRFLLFLYSGLTEHMQWDKALELYHAAHEYQVQTLKEECVFVLRNSVNVSNLCKILVCACEHEDELITSAAHEFILNNFNEVSESKEWKRYSKTHSELLIETINQLAGKGLFKKHCKK